MHKTDVPDKQETVSQTQLKLAQKENQIITSDVVLIKF